MTGPLIQTITPLTGAAAYTSSWVDVSYIEAIVFTSKSDVAGTLYAQFSNDASEGVADSVPSQLTYATAAGGNEVHRILKSRKWFRIRYVNGAAAQTTFNLQAFRSMGALLTSVVGGTVSQDNDALVVRTIPTNIEIAQGLFSGYTKVNKYGRNSDIDTGTPEDVWEGGGDYTGQPVGAAETVEIFSAAAADTSAGTGARTVEIYGLSSTNTLQQETLTLNGTTAVTSASTYNRVFRISVLTAGTGQSNAGILTLRHTTTTANIFAKVPVGQNQTSISSYTVPANKTLYITNLRISMARANGSAGSANVRMLVRESGGVYRAVRDTEVTQAQPYIVGGALLTIEVPALSDIKFRVASVSDANTIVTAEFDGVLVDD